MPQLPGDCLNNIFEYLEDDKNTLYSCMFVNRLWCEASVEIFWRNGCDYSISNVNTLVACLPNESKENLYNNGITFLTSTTKIPIFNYASFCKVLSISYIHQKIEELFENQQMTQRQFLASTNLVVQEICKMFMNQIISLKRLVLLQRENTFISTFILYHYSGAKNCLKNLSELHCHSQFSREIFSQLSKICHNISLLHLDVCLHSNLCGLTELISVQKNLKHFIITHYPDTVTEISSLIEKLPNTIIKLNISRFYSSWFINKLPNLQELELLTETEEDFIDFENLYFSELKVLRFRYSRPNNILLIRFLKNNGKNLKELSVCESDDIINLAISEFCTNLRKLSAGLKNDELETLKFVFKGCRYLKSIEFWCGGGLLNEKEALEVIAKHSHENISEIILNHQHFKQSAKLLPNELESFLINWASRVPQRLLSLVIITKDYNKMSLDKNEENMKIIKKYLELGIIKKFEVLFQ
ncbi:hypothetical protein RclHR1_00950012 [Rhizophagus clarus]|uniref:F-box domain-containing protein n=1 Tax=Rhizophagus clarus TaxID=94130 RepID=A0A2Z6SEU6_9GLOM|nr:hypothetical protein RclHR1_00950012 [Rhizophagus clarus]GES74664.1 hypothetical protein GLOIN_2v1784405 [Rhizophagus clarus]